MPQLHDRLAEIVRTKHQEVAALRPRGAELRARAGDGPPPRGLARALRVAGEVRLLAEIKRRSPSAGWIRPGAEPGEIARAYEGAGAAALSVLTDERYFGGGLEALAAAREATQLPLLRKDFVVDPLQVWEARGAGADAVLLIVRILEGDLLRELHALATELGMDTLIEVHDREELERALGAGGRLVGINNRDLRTFHTELDLSLSLAPEVPAGVTLVAESGIRTREDVVRLGSAGVDAVLVGESLMRQADVGEAAAALVGVPRSGARG